MTSQAAEKLLIRRPGFERARLPAAPSNTPNDLRHGWKPCPFKPPAPGELFRKLFGHPHTPFNLRLQAMKDTWFYAA